MISLLIWGESDRYYPSPLSSISCGSVTSAIPAKICRTRCLESLPTFSVNDSKGRTNLTQWKESPTRQEFGGRAMALSGVG